MESFLRLIAHGSCVRPAEGVGGRSRKRVKRKESKRKKSRKKDGGVGTDLAFTAYNLSLFVEPV